MISMLSHFECTTSPSSLSIEEIKLIAIVSLIFHDFFRLFMSFKYDLILLEYYSTDSVLFLSLLLFVFNIIVTPQITYSNRVIKLFCFFMLKKILNISKHSIFNCFSFFFFSKKIFNCSVISFIF